MLPNGHTSSDSHVVVQLEDSLPAPTSGYRHASPSGPWPWMDFSTVDDTTHIPNATIITTDVTTGAALGAPWRDYPQNKFKNWTQDRVEHSQMMKKCSMNQRSTIYWMDVDDDGKFATPDMSGDGSTSAFWNKERAKNIRVRSLSVDHLTSPVLCMLGTTYNIEPFFFTSSINWIPSRYQEALNHGKGDHITITLPFVRKTQRESNSRAFTAPTPSPPVTLMLPQSPPTDNKINTQQPLDMLNGDVLFIDLLAIHMVRGTETSTIISYHPESRLVSPAKRLHLLMHLVGDSAHWQNIFSKSKDPTFLFLAILWYALYAWDESFESLYGHISQLESDVLTESRVEHTRDLHILQAYLLHYQSLLHAFQLSVSFIDKTPNPAMESEKFFEEQRNISNELMKKECENLLNEIDCLQKRREMLSERLKNVMNLAFANVNIRESTSMRQVAYMTMIFLPASLIASVFGMNVKEISPGTLGTIVRYAQITIALTAFIFYVVVTLQTHTSFHERGASLRRRAAWPIILTWKILRKIAEFLLRWPTILAWKK